MKVAAFVVLLSACTVGDVGPIGGPADDDDTPPADAAPPVITGSVQITFTTNTRNGQFAPANVVAVWAETVAGFTMTIDRHSQVRTQHLVAWVQAAGPGDTDAVTGATRLNHTTPVTLTWDLKDGAGAEVPDATYTVRMEMAEDNSTTAAQNNQGTFTFVKGPAPQMQTGLTNGGFSNVSLNYTPKP